MDIPIFLYLGLLGANFGRVVSPCNGITLIGALLSLLAFISMYSFLWGDRINKAAAFGLRRTCPVCKKGGLRRLKRKAWMSIVPFSKYYSCSHCKTGFMRVFDAVRLRVSDGTCREPGGIVSRNSKKKFVLVFSATTGLVYFCYQMLICLYQNVLQ
jgi:hypothetical protein